MPLNKEEIEEIKKEREWQNKIYEVIKLFLEENEGEFFSPSEIGQEVAKRLKTPFSSISIEEIRTIAKRLHENLSGSGASLVNGEHWSIYLIIRKRDKAEFFGYDRGSGTEWG